MKCACPCGEEFEPERTNQVYVNAQHRKRDKNRRWPVKRQSVSPELPRNGPTERSRAQTSGVTPLLGTDMAQTQNQRVFEARRKRESAEFLSRRQVADLLGVSVWSLIWWRRSHCGPPCVKVGRNTVRYPREELDKWLASLPRS